MSSLYFPTARVLLNEKISATYYRMRVEVSKSFSFLPGQFIMVRIPERLNPFLGRPMAILSVQEGKLEFCYRVMGEGTAELTRLRKKDAVSLWGPLGNSFSVPLWSIALIAGGVGMPPLYSLAEALFNKRCSKKGIHFFYGGKSAPDILFVEKLERYCEEVTVMTEDGSAGGLGLVSKAFIEFLDEKKGRKSKIERALEREKLHVASCGPSAMMQVIARICKERKIACEVSLEERMACGVGVCLGCAADVKREGRKERIRLCMEGPVLDAAQVIWKKRGI